jgi:hypothetical protein
MQLPIVTEISALSAHRREVALVRWSLMAVPEHTGRRHAPDPADPLRRMAPQGVSATAASGVATRNVSDSTR